MQSTLASEQNLCGVSLLQPGLLLLVFGGKCARWAYMYDEEHPHSQKQQTLTNKQIKKTNISSYMLLVGCVIAYSCPRIKLSKSLTQFS